MLETTQPTSDQRVYDPSSDLDSDYDHAEKLQISVRFETFGEAQTAKKRLSDTFIDGAIADDLRVGREKVGIKGYLDRVEVTPKDVEVIDDPERIAGLYLATTEMLARNLTLRIVPDSSPERAHARKQELKRTKAAFLSGLAEEAPQAAAGIVDWCKGLTKKFSVRAVEYHGFTVDGKDILDSEGEGLPDVRSNFKIQRQFAGQFLMAYSDKRVREKITDHDKTLDKRIYLNPSMEATPQLFEQILRAANEAGISLQLKMFQRAPEVATAHAYKRKGMEAGGLRGDGIVVYVDGEHADEALGIVLALVKDNPEAFKGRQTSRIPQKVAEGIAVGDEPVQMSGVSLTTHREMLFNYAADRTRSSGLRGEEARALFRDLVRRIAIANGVNPENIAFNAK